MNIKIKNNRVTLYFSTVKGFKALLGVLDKNCIEYKTVTDKEDYIINLPYREWLIWGLDYECKDLV